MKAVASLVEGLVSYAGGVAETTEGGILVLLPPEKARAAGLAETMELSFEGDVTYESDILDRLAPLLGEGGRREVWQPVEPYLRRSGLEEAVERELSVLNGLLRPSEAKRGVIAYDTHVFRYVAISEETCEEMVRVTVNTLTGAAIAGLPEALSELPRSGEEASPCESVDPAGGFAAACAEAERMVRLLLEPFVKSLERRLARDVQRLRGYYGSLSAQVDGRRLRTSEDEKRDRKAAIARELERKLHEIDSRYAVNVEMKPVCVSRAVMPVMLIPVTVVRRRTERQYMAVWNPVLKGIEPLPCACCFLPVKSFHLCDASAHVVCPDCARRYNLRRSCPACGR